MRANKRDKEGKKRMTGNKRALRREEELDRREG